MNISDYYFGHPDSFVGCELNHDVNMNRKRRQNKDKN